MVIKLIAKHELRMLWYKSQRRKLFAKNVQPPGSYFLQPLRNCSDVKTNQELLFSNQTIVPSVHKIKRTIKSRLDLDFIDGFACIQTSCPVCPLQDESLQQPQQQQTKEANKAGASKSNRLSLFINKTSGKKIYFQ